MTLSFQTVNIEWGSGWLYQIIEVFQTNKKSKCGLIENINSELSRRIWLITDSTVKRLRNHWFETFCSSQIHFEYTRSLFFSLVFWLHRAACGNLSFLTRDWTCVPCVEVWSLNPRIVRQVPTWSLLTHLPEPTLHSRLTLGGNLR